MLYINDTSQVELRERRFELAYEALCRLNTRDDLKHRHDPDTGEPCFHNMPSDYDRKCTNLIGILDRLGIIVERDELTGDIIGVSDELDLSEDFLTFLTVLAPYFEPGSYIELFDDGYMDDSTIGFDGGVSWLDLDHLNVAGMAEYTRGVDIVDDPERVLGRRILLKKPTA